MGFIRGAANVLAGAMSASGNALGMLSGLRGSLKSAYGSIRGAAKMGAGAVQLGVRSAQTIRGPVGRGLSVTGWGGKLAGGVLAVGALGAAASMGGYSLANSRYNMDNARRSDMPIGMSNMAGSSLMQFGGRQWRDPNADGSLALALSNSRKG